MKRKDNYKKRIKSEETGLWTWTRVSALLPVLSGLDQLSYFENESTQQVWTRIGFLTVEVRPLVLRSGISWCRVATRAQICCQTRTFAVKSAGSSAMTMRFKLDYLTLATDEPLSALMVMFPLTSDGS